MLRNASVVFLTMSLSSFAGFHRDNGGDTNHLFKYSADMKKLEKVQTRLRNTQRSFCSMAKDGLDGLEALHYLLGLEDPIFPNRKMESRKLLASLCQIGSTQFVLSVEMDIHGPNAALLNFPDLNLLNPKEMEDLQARDELQGYLRSEARARQPVAACRPATGGVAVDPEQFEILERKPGGTYALESTFVHQLLVLMKIETTQDSKWSRLIWDKRHYLEAYFHVHYHDDREQVRISSELGKFYEYALVSGHWIDLPEEDALKLAVYSCVKFTKTSEFRISISIGHENFAPDLKRVPLCEGPHWARHSLRKEKLRTKDNEKETKIAPNVLMNLFFLRTKAAPINTSYVFCPSTATAYEIREWLSDPVTDDYCEASTLGAGPGAT